MGHLLWRLQLLCLLHARWTYFNFVCLKRNETQKHTTTMYISRSETGMSATQKTAVSGAKNFILVMQYTRGSSAPSYIFHNQYKT